jgi:hypothetical protein
LETEILNILTYFDIFDHPLKKDEILNLTIKDGSYKGFEADLKNLVDRKVCFLHGEYYSIRENILELISERNKKELEAQKYFRKLPFYVKIIAAVPFVRAVAISGSLSKNVMWDDGDIDYFIVTATDRLWISRTLLILFKKIFLLNSRKYFCLNYFVDENNFKIPDENMFTAMELCYLLPVYNSKLIKDLQESNLWVKKIIPNFVHPLTIDDIETKSKAKKLIEYLLKGSLGNKLDIFLMNLTFLRWKKKFNEFHPLKFEQTMRTNRGISKHHPLNYQQKVLEEFDIRLKNLNLKR